IPRRHLQGRLETRVASISLAFGDCIKTIAEQIETDAGNVLRNKFDRSNRFGVISLKGNVETLILGSPTVIGEVQRFLNQAVEVDASTLAAAGAGMLQHAFDDIVGTPSVLGDLF